MLLDARRTSVWLLGALLFVSGFSQLAGLVIAIPDEWTAGMGLVTAITCWAAVLTLLSLLSPGPAAGTDLNYEREIAERLQCEEALRCSEAETRKLVEADVRKNEFLAMLGHELRNPLAPIRYAVKIMKQCG